MKTGHPEITRAAQAIETAVRQIDAEGGCVDSFASALLVQAAALYGYVHNHNGPEGSAAVLQRLADIHARQGAEAQALADHGQAGRA